MIAWALDALIGATLLMLLVLAVRRPVAEAFGAGWAYALWLLPLLRFFMPPLDMFFEVASALPQRTVILIPAAGAAAAPLPASAGPGQWVPFLLALWAGGAAVFILWQQSAYSALLLSLGRDGRPTEPSSFGGIRVVASEAVDGPIAIGFVNRRIAVPLDFTARYSPAEQRLALEHELVHHRRGDIWWNAAALIVLTINWFNPIAHFAFRAFRMDQELACDSAIAGRTDTDGRCDYARALVKSASRPGQIAACPLNSADQLKRRLKMLKTHRATRARALGGSAAVAALMVAGLAVSSPGFAREEAPAPRVLLASAAADPIISARDVATIRERCANGSAVVQSTGESGTIICENGERIEDSEVHAIVAKAVKGAKERIAAADLDMRQMKAELKRSKLSAADLREIEDAVAEAKVAVREIEMEEPMEHARAAMERAREQIARIDIHRIRSAALASAMSSVRAPHIHISPMPHVKLKKMTPEIRAEIEAAMAEARAEIEEIDADAIRDEVDAELDRELDRND